MSRRRRQRLESPDSYTPPSSLGSNIEEGDEVDYLQIELHREDWANKEVRDATSKYSDFSSALACYKHLSHTPTRSLFDILPCYEGEAVCDSPLEGERACFTYMYNCVLSKLGVRMPFTDFQCEILRTLNVAPTQLHPNSWGFIRAFEILCGGLGLPLSAYSYFSFFQAKSSKTHSWIYMSNRAKHTLITPLTSSWKKFKNDFIRITPSPTSPLWFDDSGAPFFPFHWTKRPVTKPDLCSFPHSVEDKRAITVLRTMQTVTVAKLLHYENNTDKLSSYLRSAEMVMTDEERARIRRQVEEEQNSQGNVDARDKNQDAIASNSDVDPSAHLKKKQKRKKTTGNAKAVVPVPIRVSPHVSPRPTAWDVHFSGEGVIPHYTTPSDVMLIKDLGFEQSLEAVRAYSLWSASLATETSRTLKEERSRYLSSLTSLRSSLNQAEIDLHTKTDAFNTLSESFETTKDELKASHSKCSELESKMKSLQISDKEKDKKLEGIAKELEKKDKRIYALERSSLEEYEHGFSRAVEQLEVLHPGLDVSGANSRFVVREGRIVDPEARSTFGVVIDRRRT